MKLISIKVVAALCTFIVGIIVETTWFVNPTPKISDIPPVNDKIEIPAPPIPKATPDSTVYSVKFCELIKNSERYDGKIVRIQAFYLQGIDTVALTDSKCQEWLRPSCNRKDVPCEKIWNRIGFGSIRVDMVGRYTADIVDPDPNQNGYRVRLFEILELKDARRVKIQKNPSR